MEGDRAAHRFWAKWDEKKSRTLCWSEFKTMPRPRRGSSGSVHSRWVRTKAVQPNKVRLPVNGASAGVLRTIDARMQGGCDVWTECISEFVSTACCLYQDILEQLGLSCKKLSGSACITQKQVLTDCPLRCPVNRRSRSIIASSHLSILYLGGCNTKTLVQVELKRRPGNYTLCLGFENVEKWITEFLQRQTWRS